LENNLWSVKTIVDDKTTKDHDDQKWYVIPQARMPVLNNVSRRKL
jgi:hypothetical protein